MSTTGVYEGTVKIFGGQHAEGEELRKVRITTLGDTVKLSSWFPERGLFQEVDFLDNAVTTEKGGKVIFKGTSRELTAEVGLPAGNAEVTWELKEQACRDCH